MTHPKMHETLVGFDLFKANPASETDKAWTFQGVASDESADVEGDEMLKSIVDLSYAQTRGYVNWNHSQDPKDQLGCITRIEVVDGEYGIDQLRKSLGDGVSDTASIYVEGELYKSVPKAQDVWNIIQSAPANTPGLGISLEGGLQRYKSSGKLAKAIVRGIAITPTPVHPKTMLALRKALSAATEEPLQKAAGLSYDEAVLWVLRQRPKWDIVLAENLVRYTMQNTEGATA